MRQICSAVLVVGTLMAALAAQAGSVTTPIQAGGSFSVPATSLKEIRFKSTVHQQYDFSCGSAAVATLLTHHYGYPMTEARAFEEMYVRGDQEKIRNEGFSLLDIKLLLEAHGFQADGYEVPLSTLETARIPALALIREEGYLHFVVVKGMRGGRVLLGDPSAGTRTIPREAFESRWVNGILFVIRNQQESAQFNRDVDWRVAPSAPLVDGINRQGLGAIVIPKHGPGDF